MTEMTATDAQNDAILIQEIQTADALATDAETKAGTTEVTEEMTTDAETESVQATDAATTGAMMKEDTAVLIQKDATAETTEDFHDAMIILTNTNEFSKINRK